MRLATMVLAAMLGLVAQGGATRASDCAHLYVGSWTVYLRTGQTYPVTVTPTTAIPHCPMCASSGWVCNGRQFTTLGMIRVDHTLSDDGMRLDTSRGYALRNGPPPPGMAAAAAPAPSPSPPPRIGGAQLTGQAWENNPTRENCEKASEITKSSDAYWGVQCARYFTATRPPAGAGGPSARADGAPVDPPGAAHKTLKPRSGQPAAANAAPPPIPPALYDDADDGLECGQRGGHRARGLCFAEWDNASQADCDALRGSYYPRDARGPAFCAYGAAANPRQNTPDARDCGFAGGTMQNGTCMIMGLTRDDCASLSGRIIESGGYQYCGYDPAKVVEVKQSQLRRKLRAQLLNKFGG